MEINLKQSDAEFVVNGITMPHAKNVKEFRENYLPRRNRKDKTVNVFHTHKGVQENLRSIAGVLPRTTYQSFSYVHNIRDMIGKSAFNHRHAPARNMSINSPPPVLRT